MEPTSSRCLHLAVTPTEYTKICGLQNLNPSVFSWKPVDNYFKLSSSQEAAVHQALKSRTIESAKAALEFTTCYILTLHLTDKQWCDLCMAKKEPYIIMAMGCRGKVFHFYGTLCISEVTKDLHITRLCPTGIDRWADHALEQCVVCPEGLCAECGAKGVKVYKSKKQCKKDWYCSRCWYEYIRNTWKAEGQQDGQTQEN